MSLILLFAALAMSSLEGDFDGLTLSGVVAEKPASEHGEVRSWAIPNIIEIDGTKTIVGNTSVTVTDISAVAQPTFDQVFDLHVRALGSVPKTFALNISRYRAKMGDHPVGFTLGSVIFPAAGGGYTATYLTSMVLPIDKKVYEVVRMRTSGPYSELDFSDFRQAKFTSGDKTLSITEMPDPWADAFQIPGVPFRLDWAAIPSPLIVATAPKFATSYSAWGFFESWHASYELRKLKPDYTFDPEKFIKDAFVNQVQYTSLTVSDVAKTENEDRWTARVVFTLDKGRDQKGTVELLKKGDWVAGHMLRGETTVPDMMAEKFKVSLIK